MNVKERVRTRKNVEFDIQPEDILMVESCPILGIPLFFTPGRVSNNTPTLDRIDNTKGYVKGNIRVISNKANRLKADNSIETLKAILNYSQSIECKGCESGIADGPTGLCPGCQAYRDHQS